MQRSKNKPAFTLIELMVAITLTVIIVLFLYKTLATQTKANEVIQKHLTTFTQKELLYHLLELDFAKANKIEIQKSFNKDYNILFLETKNSLHEIPFSYVVYYVNAKNKTLVRLESAYPIHLPVPIENVKFVFAYTLLSHIQKFRIFTSKNKKHHLLFLKNPKNNLVFEL